MSVKVKQAKLKWLKWRCKKWNKIICQKVEKTGEFGVLIPFYARTLEKLMRHVYLKSIYMSQIRVKFTYRVTIWAK